MQADNFDDQDRERLERLLSHPESAEHLTEALSKAIISNQETDGKHEVNNGKLLVNKSKPEVDPQANDAAINITRHFMISGGLLAGVLLLAAAVATPLRDTFTVCFNPAPVPNTSKCLGVKTYTIDQDHIEKLVSHPALVIVPDKSDRTRLGSEFTNLRDALLKGEFNSSIIFTTTGGNRIGITPQFERKTLVGLRQKSSPNKAQTGFIRSKHIPVPS